MKITIDVSGSQDDGESFERFLKLEIYLLNLTAYKLAITEW